MKKTIHIIIIVVLAMNFSFIVNAQTNLTINVSNVKGTMDGRGAGYCNSYISDTPELTPNLKKSGAATLRFPMGSLGKNYLFHSFDNDYDDLDQGLRPRVVTRQEYFQAKNQAIDPITYELDSKYLDFDEFMVMCNEVGAEPVIMLSVEGDLLEESTITKAQLLRNNIEWVKYAKNKGYNIKYWEYGNEVHFGRPHSLITAEEYASRYLYVQDTIKQIDPNIKLGVVTVGFNNYVDILQMLEIPELISNMDFFVTHQYNNSGINDYPKWKAATQDIVNPSWDNTQDDIRDIKRAIKYFDDRISDYPNLANLEYLITEHSTSRIGDNWAELPHITHSISTFQQISNMFLYDQRVKYSHFWITSRPGTDVPVAFDWSNNWEITTFGMPVLIYNKFILNNLIQPVVGANGTVGCYASSSSDGKRLTLFVINKNEVAGDVNITLSNLSPDLNAQLNTKWIFSGSGDPYDKNPELEIVGSATVENNILTTSLKPISLTIIELGVGNSTVSITEHTSNEALNNIRIYPNPWSDTPLNIELGRASSSKITIYDLKGIKVFSEDVNTDKLVIDNGVLRAGIYIVTVMQDGQKKHFKLIVK